MDKISVRFRGDILKSGFWIYVWKVTHEEKIYYYVGRTGDSSSVNAASPMSRWTTHIGNNKKGNTLKRHITSLGIN